MIAKELDCVVGMGIGIDMLVQCPACRGDRAHAIRNIQRPYEICRECEDCGHRWRIALKPRGAE